MTAPQDPAPPAFERKICLPADVAQCVRSLPRPVVFTNGVFDILHRGHVTYLAEARALGASLVVGLNSDASVRRLGKGDDRPINREEESSRGACSAGIRRPRHDVQHRHPAGAHPGRATRRPRQGR